MSLSKWKLGSWKKSLSRSRNSDTTPTSSSLKSRMSSPNSKPSSDSGSGNSNKSEKTSSSLSSASSSSSPISWFRPSSHRSKKRKSIISRDDPAFARLHKPFTPQNLEHQKLLSAFEWNFYDDGQNDQRRASLSLSPCASRNATVDDYARGYGYDRREQWHDYDPDYGMLPPNGRHDTLSDSLARLSGGLAQEGTA